MVSIFVRTDSYAQIVKEVRCLSTDDKPTAGMPNGSTCIEIDTGKVYSPVTVNVPNTYTAADEGKVVDNGQLVEQASASGVSF